MAEEQTSQGVQDPVQPAAPAAPAAPAVPGPAPWSQDLQTRFDPQTAAQVDAYLREAWQPRMTQIEQERAAAEAQFQETEGARQMLEAFQTDPHAANIAVQRQLYGDEYANQVAMSLGRNDLVVSTTPNPQQPAQPVQQEVQEPVHDENWEYWDNKRQQEQYDEAKATFLRDPQYADINADLFDPFVQGAESWEEAVNAYRAYAAQFAATAPDPVPTPAPPTIGSETGGTPGNTPSYPHETLNEAIDAIFSENQPIAPPVMGGQ